MSARPGGPVPSAPPGRELAVTIECTAHVGERFGALHRIVIHPDWTIETPHDLDAERIARSFGSWNTCLEFVEQAVPAYRRALELMARAGGPDQRQKVPAALSPARVFPVDRAPGAGDSPMPVAMQHLYAQLFARAGRVWAESGDPRQIAGGAEGFLELWYRGLLPATVAEYADAFPPEAWPLPPALYLRVASGEADVEWLTRVITCYPDREFVDWALAHERRVRDRIPVHVVQDMSAAGLSANDAVGALSAGIPLETLVELASQPSIGGPRAARWLTVWARLGVQPTAAHYRLLEANRALLELPPLWLLDWATNALRGYGPRTPDRTELAVMLALTTDVELIESAVRAGVRAATDARFTDTIRRRRTR